MRNRALARKQVARWIEAHEFMGWEVRLSDLVFLMRAVIAQRGR